MQGILPPDNEGRSVVAVPFTRSSGGGGGGASLAKVILANGHAPWFIADVNEDVTAAVECAEGDASVGGVSEGVDFEGFLDDEDGFLEGFAGEADGGVAGDDTHGAVLSHNGSGEV